MNVKDKIVLITGSTRGIGNAIAREFVNNGAKVVICGSRLENAIKSTKELIEELNIPEDNILPVGITGDYKFRSKNLIIRIKTRSNK